MATRRFMDDIARLVTDASGAAQGVKREVETAVRTQAERMLRDMDVATREEVDVLRDLIASLREENGRLARRIEALERGERAVNEASSAEGVTAGQG